MNGKTLLNVLVATAIITAVSCKPQEIQESVLSAKTKTKGKTMETIKPNTEALSNPSLANETAPDTFNAVFKTTKGDVTIEVHRDWSPLGADRFYNMVKIGYFTDIAFFRVISGFMAQFGIHGDPAVSAKWRDAKISDDPVKESNTKGRISFATAGPGTRTTQLFINYGNNGNLDSMGFSPFGEVTEGMEVIENIYSGYGEGAPSGQGPRQDLAQMQGNEYIKKDFPKLDYVISASIK